MDPRDVINKNVTVGEIKKMAVEKDTIEKGRIEQAIKVLRQAKKWGTAQWREAGVRGKMKMRSLRTGKKPSPGTKRRMERIGGKTIIAPAAGIGYVVGHGRGRKKGAK